MKIRADLTEPARLTPAEWSWVASPQAGVERVMLDRDGDEVAVATSFVRYAPESRFPAHGHALGEEYVVLEGEFGDEHGRFPPGSYVRNPPGSSHTPFSDPGCLIWVKLRQFDTADQRQCELTLDLPIPDTGSAERVLHAHDAEVVREITGAAGAGITLGDAGEAVEVLVLAGAVSEPGASLPAWSWLRIPAGAEQLLTVTEPARLLTKTRPIYPRD